VLFSFKLFEVPEVNCASFIIILVERLTVDLLGNTKFIGHPYLLRFILFVVCWVLVGVFTSGSFEFQGAYRSLFLQNWPNGLDQLFISLRLLKLVITFFQLGPSSTPGEHNVGV
jgi:hypothetical protein